MPANVLLYWATAGYVHDSIPDSREAIKSRPLEVNNIPVVFEDTDDKSWFTDETLEKYDAIVFLNNSGYGILDDTGKAALQKWINLGGNFVGIHCAADALRDTPFFGRQLGAYFHYHPKISEATVKVVDANHPSTKPLPKNGSWTLVDEMYCFESNPLENPVNAKLLLVADPTSYIDDDERRNQRKFVHDPHPIAWYQEKGAGVEIDKGGIAGRSWYTSLGHEKAIWRDETFLGHVFGGIQWALESNTTRAFNTQGKVGGASN